MVTCMAMNASRNLEEIRREGGHDSMMLIPAPPSFLVHEAFLVHDVDEHV